MKSKKDLIINCIITGAVTMLASSIAKDLYEKCKNIDFKEMKEKISKKKNGIKRKVCKPKYAIVK